MHDLTTEKTIGILGGGQLALMMAQRAGNLGLKLRVFDKNPECPAATSGCEVQTNLKDFFKNLHVVTFENEFINLEEILPIIQKQHIHFFPTLETIDFTQNKLTQKLIFKKLEIPTTNFSYYDPKMDNLDDWLKSLKLPVVLKWAFGGYDGRGNLIFKSQGQFTEVQKFCQQALVNNTTVYAEDFVDFQRELAVVFVQSLKGDFIHYPMVISEQENNICKTVYGPAEDFTKVNQIEDLAVQIGKTLAEAMGYVGTFALEFFQTNSGMLLVNEMAPRVHNSGHYTQDAFEVDQFENHLRAILGLPLTLKPKSRYFLMHNLLGPEDLNLNLPEGGLDQILNVEAGIHPHWYGKTELKPRRKMGHLNLMFNDKDQVQSKKSALVDAEQKIWQNIRKHYGN